MEDQNEQKIVPEAGTRKGVFEQLQSHTTKLQETLARLNEFADKLQGNTHHSSFSKIEHLHPHEPGLSSIIDGCERKLEEINKCIDDIKGLF